MVNDPNEPFLDPEKNIWEDIEINSIQPQDPSGICCVIVALGPLFEIFGDSAVKSFSRFHPHTPLMYVTNDRLDGDPFFLEWPLLKKYKARYDGKLGRVGLLKYAIAHKIMADFNFAKIIILGADTITCSRLDEFLDTSNVDAVLTAGNPGSFISDHWSGVHGQPHVNADVVCFNSLTALATVISNSIKYLSWHEEGGLNETFCDPLTSFTSKIVDADHKSPVYNLRSKCTQYKETRDEVGNRLLCASSVSSELPPDAPSGITHVGPDGKGVIGTLPIKPADRPWKRFVEQFYVEDDKLFAGDGRQIMVWHFAEGIGANPYLPNMIEIAEYWIHEGFTQEIQDFFEEICGVDIFFHIDSLVPTPVEEGWTHKTGCPFPVRTVLEIE